MNTGDIRLLVGLGNPGSKFSATRHNIGFMALERLASREGVSFKMQKKLHGCLAEIWKNKRPIRLLLPNTYMNDSGKSIKAALQWFGLNINQMIILVDDIDLPLGKIRLRKQGSSGGHNGLKSTINHIGTKNFCRLRIGIGAPSKEPEERRAMTVSHVLGKFSSKENHIVDQVLEELLIGLELIHSQSIDIVSNRLNSYKPNEID